MHYLTQQLAALQDRGSAAHFEVLTAPWNHAALAATSQLRLRRLPLRSAADRFAFEQTLLVALARRWDLLYSPANFGPIVPLRGTRSVLTLQNANYFGAGARMPHNAPAARRLKIALSRRSAVASSTVVAISHSLADEVRSEGLPLRRLCVLPSGLPTWPDEVKPVEQLAPPHLREQGFVLSVAADYPHKRLDDVVLAWGRFRRDSGAGPKLVMAGDVSQQRQQEWARVAGPYIGDLVVLGNVDTRASVRWLYENCLVAVITSELEASPLTPAEAISLGAPLLLSDIPAHREVAGEGAELVPVGDVASFAAHLSGLCARGWPRRRGEMLLPLSSWGDNAEGLMNIFTETLADR